MTKAELFVPQAMSRAIAIKHKIQELQDACASLRADYVACGGDTMAGADTYEFTNLYAITRTEFQTAMLGLTSPHNAVSLFTIASGGAFANVMLLANGQ